MATFIKGVTDQFGPLQLYRPDYQFLTQVYGTRQAQYDRGFNMVKSLYNSVLNNSVTNQENEKFRQEAFKKLQGSLKSMSNVDLSNPANVMRAQTLIDPISKDEELAYDMSVTRFHQKQKQLMETYRNSTDPKMRAMYSDISRMDIQFAEEDLANAKRGDGSIRQVQPREFTPFEDVQEYLRTEAKKQGLEITQSGPDGRGYMLKRTNGIGAVPIFNSWAASVMGQRFDRQFGVMGRVNAESAIRNTMQTMGVSRDEAVRTISSKLAPQINIQESTKGITADKELTKLEKEIKFFEKEYPNGFPPAKPEIAEEYQKLVEARDQYNAELENSRSEVGKLQTEGVQYVASNLYGIFSRAAKEQTALSFAQSYATAKQSVEMRPDTTWATKANIASRERVAANNLAMQERKLQWDMQKTGMANELKMLELKADGKLPGETFVGSAVLDANDKPLFASDQLSQSTAQNREQAYLAAFNSENGLMRLVVDDPSEYSRLYSSIAKIKNMGAGQNVKLTQQDVANLQEYGKMVGVRIGVPNSARTANALIESLAGLTYNAATKELSKYDRAHKISKLNPYIESFRKSMRAFHAIDLQNDKLEQDISRVAKEILNPDGTIKSIYKGAVIRSGAGGQIKDIDLSAVSEVGKANLTKMISGFKDREYPVMNRYNYTKLSAAEIDLLLRNSEARSSVMASDGNTINPELFKNMNTADLAKLFGDEADVTFDAINRQVKVKLNVSQQGELAKRLGVSKGAQSLTVMIPYEDIQSSRGAYGRFEKYINTNTVNSTSLGELTPFLTNPSATVMAPASSSNRGFDWTAQGVIGKNGQPEIMVNFKYKNPKTNRIEQMTERMPYQPGNVESIDAVLKLIADRDANHFMSITAYEKHINQQR
jgi:hypothetical protein